MSYVAAINAPRGRRRPRLAQGVAVGVLLVLVYRHTLASLWDTWNTNDNYSHGPLIPLVSLALVWLRRDRLPALPIVPETRALALVALACLLHAAGVRTDLFALQCWSILPMLFGLSLTFLGVPWTRMLAFPIGYLAFMLTFPPMVMNEISYALKEIAVRVSVWAAGSLGVAVRRVGMSLFLPTGELRVENPCSGLRSLLSLLATGTLFAYFQPGGAVRRATVLLAALPVALLSNIVRLLVIIVVAGRWGIYVATGIVHDFTGVVLFAIALAILVGVRVLLLPRPGQPAQARP